MTLFLCFRHYGELTPTETHSSATVNDSNEQIGQELNGDNFRLIFAGNPFEKEPGLLVDIGLSNEAVIEIISEIPIWGHADGQRECEMVESGRTMPFRTTFGIMV